MVEIFHRADCTRRKGENIPPQRFSLKGERQPACLILGGETQAGKNRILCMSEFMLKKGISFPPFMQKHP